MAARLRTLPAAVAPVLVGTALSATERDLRVGGFVAALLGAIFIQVGTNLSNDYSDARRGADAEDRLGPVRVTAGGLVPPRQVLVATYVSFGLAVLCGVYLVWLAGPILLAIGAASILAGVLYTGGPRPYGYAGLGELFVLVFFGIVPVVGTAYVQTLAITGVDVVASVGVGLLACAILVTNNLRDIAGDTVAGKITLAVRLGDARTRAVYAVIVVAAVLVPLAVAALTSPWVALTCLTGLLAVRPVRVVVGGATGPALIPALKQTGVLLLVYGLVLGGLLALA
jgi:1,4-dihydroxy-2-naphthoate octaprenyltransferase